jgi:hypothetical protein
MMKKLIQCLIVLACFGCANSENTPPIYFSDLGTWESVEVKQLGIGYDAPKDRYDRGTSDIPVLGRMTTGFGLHRLDNGFLAEYSLKIIVTIEVYSKSEWKRFLRGDHTLIYSGIYGEYEHKFCPRYLHHRKDVMAPDGSVAVACAIIDHWIYDKRANGEAQDEATAKRIIESVHFIGASASKR